MINHSRFNRDQVEQAIPSLLDSHVCLRSLPAIECVCVCVCVSTWVLLLYKFVSSFSFAISEVLPVFPQVLDFTHRKGVLSTNSYTLRSRISPTARHSIRVRTK